MCGWSWDVEWCECECGCVGGGAGGGCACGRGRVGCVCEVWCVCDLVCVSLSENGLGAEGGAAMAGAVQHLTSLTTLGFV